MRKHLMFVDDEQAVLDAIRRLLHGHEDRWEIDYVDRAETAWENLQRTPYDAVVTDVSMPGMSGLELLQRIQATEETRTLPVVVLTGLADRKLKPQALHLGAADLLNKPVEHDQLVARLENVLRMKAYLDGLENANVRLRGQVRQQSMDLAGARLNLVCRLGKAAEHRDEQTGNHVLRVGHYSWLIAAALGLDRGMQDLLLLTAPLHDLGKIGIPDRILLKGGPLSPGEWTVMQAHCVIGYQMLQERSALLGPLQGRRPESFPAELLDDSLLRTAATIALCHHEKWDGTGYPHRLVGERIPLEARIVAIADVFDALTSSRPYRGPCSEDEALAIIGASIGSHFAPDVHAALLAALPEIQAIRRQYADGRNTVDAGGGETP